MNSKLTISIIINSFGRTLESLLKTISLAEKTNPLEIILIDQNEKSLEINSSKIKLFHYPEKAISKARNFGAQKALGEWILFLDDDALIDANALNDLRIFISQHDSDIVGGKIMVSENSSEYYSKRQKIASGPVNFLNLKTIMGGLFAIKKETFNNLNGFDPQFGIGGEYPSSEDTDLIWKAYFAQKKISFCSNFFALHPRSSNISNEKAFQYGIGKGAMVAKWIKKERKYICFLEFVEMLIIPLLKGNLYSLKGRIKGWMSYDE